MWNSYVKYVYYQCLSKIDANTCTYKVTWVISSYQLSFTENKIIIVILKMTAWKSLIKFVYNIAGLQYWNFKSKIVNVYSDVIQIPTIQGNASSEKIPYIFPRTLQRISKNYNVENISKLIKQNVWRYLQKPLPFLIISLFLIKLQAWDLYLKRDPDKGNFVWILRNFYRFL